MFHKMALAALGWALLVAPAQAAESALADPVKRNHFCQKQFEDLSEWEQCQAMWPYARDPIDAKSPWLKCERESSSKDKLDEAKLAACLRKLMK
ncbi:hypothetical protein DK058_25515 [Salmonella enterica subsp. enterica serovar Typhi]|nr:hypothetical protein [Salmonella enterica subsp. enterica serovar Typhi]MIL09428.1 hypothetical protein [Salmonella enterica subsp. enterica serovar Enteritidis]